MAAVKNAAVNMGCRYPRRHTNGQQACGKVLAITSQQENANQSQNEIASSIISLKDRRYVGEDVEKLESLYTAGGKVKW